MGVEAGRFFLLGFYELAVSRRFSFALSARIAQNVVPEATGLMR